MLSGSWLLSLSVASVSVALGDPAAKVAVLGSALGSVSPVSRIETSTVSSSSVLPVRLSVKVAFSPSLKSPAEGVIVTKGFLSLIVIVFVLPLATISSVVDRISSRIVIVSSISSLSSSRLKNRVCAKFPPKSDVPSACAVTKTVLSSSLVL